MLWDAFLMEAWGLLPDVAQQNEWNGATLATSDDDDALVRLY